MTADQQLELPLFQAARKGCQTTSNGQRCRYYANHDGTHSYGGGLSDPVSPRHCGEPAEHEPHAWSRDDRGKDDRGKDWCACSGRALGKDAGQ